MTTGSIILGICIYIHIYTYIYTYLKVLGTSDGKEALRENLKAETGLGRLPNP